MSQFTQPVTPPIDDDGPATRQNHVSHVLAKLQVSDRTQAALRMRGL